MLNVMYKKKIPAVSIYPCTDFGMKINKTFSVECVRSETA